jgi:hypothetical protein
MFFGAIRYIWHLNTSGVGSFAFKSSFSYRAFRFSCLGVVSPGRKMAPKFVQVWGSYTRFFYCLCWLLLTILLRKMAPNFEHVKRAAESIKKPRTGSVTSFNVIPPKQHLHGRCLGIPVRGYGSSCGNSNSLAPLTQ